MAETSASLDTAQTRTSFEPASIPGHWRVGNLGTLGERNQRTVNPRNFPDELFEYYSIPAYQEFSAPVLERGKNILSNKLLVDSDTVLFGKLNPRVLKVWLVRSTAPYRKIASTEFLPVSAGNQADSDFVYFLCQSECVVAEAQRLVTGSTPSRQRVDPASFYEIQIPLPPLPEQRAIARALRAVQEAKEARQRELALERERKAALMEFLFTHGTRGEPIKQSEFGEIPNTWAITRLADVCEFLQYGTSRRCDVRGEGVPVLGIPNVVHGRVDGNGLRFLQANDVERSRLELRTGDLIFVRTNANREYTGRCAVFGNEIPHALFASYLIRARLKPQTLIPNFLREYTDTSRGKAYLSGRASPAADGKFNINTQTIRAVLVPQPSWEEQNEIASILGACDKKADALEGEFALLNEFFRAMLEELMTGRLSAAPLIEPEAAS